MSEDTASLIRCGTVIDLGRPQAKCRIAYGDPDSDEGDAEKGWIDWPAPRAGNTRIWSPLSLGKHVLLCPDGQLSAAVALPGLWRDISAPPSDQAEDLITWPDGASVRYSPNPGAMQIDLPAGATLEANAPGGITRRGGVTIEGDVSVTGKIEATGDVVGDGVCLKPHRHGGVPAGAAQSGPPV